MTTLKLFRFRDEPVLPSRDEFAQVKFFNRAMTKYQSDLDLFEKQQRDLLWLALYFNKAWTRCKAKPADELTPFRLLRLRASISRENRDLVKAVANIWFIQRLRGNNQTGKVSAWSHRAAPKLNDKMRNIINVLRVTNAQQVEEAWEVMGQKDDIKIVFKTTVTFKTRAEASLFSTLFRELEVPEENVQGTKQSPERSRAEHAAVNQEAKARILARQKVAKRTMVV